MNFDEFIFVRPERKGKKTFFERYVHKSTRRVDIHDFHSALSIIILYNSRITYDSQGARNRLCCQYSFCGGVEFL